MVLSWETSNTFRPNRYLDWQYRNRPPQSDNEGLTWVSALIEIQKDKGKYLHNLENLLKEVMNGYSQDGGSNSENLSATIRMHDDELELLKKLILRIVNEGYEPTDSVEVWFFVYLPEEKAYKNGDFEHKKNYYNIRFAGPPIEGFDTGLKIFSRTQFQKGAVPAQTAVGIIDDSIAFAHERFRSKNDKTRIQAVWLQNLERARRDGGVTFGARLKKREIDDLISKHSSESEIYRKKGQLDFGKAEHSPLAWRRSHGTHVMDLAAGFDPEEIDDTQISPVFAVQLPVEATADTSGITMGSYVLQALRLIMLWADEFDAQIHLIVNFSYGILAGPKDGTNDLEWIIEELVRYRNDRSIDRALTTVVLPAGNSYRNRDTAKMRFKASNKQSGNGEAQTIEWKIQPDDLTPNYLEIWTDETTATNEISPIVVSLTTPDGTEGHQPAPGSVCVLMQNGAPVAAIYCDPVKIRNESDKGLFRWRIFIAVNPTHSWEGAVNLASAGVWEVSVRSVSASETTARLYIQRDDTPVGYPHRSRRSSFDDALAYERDPMTGGYTKLADDCPITHEGTLSAIANGEATLVIGAAEDSDNLPPADYTSSGPTLTRPGPDLSAIADEGSALWGVIAAGTYSGSLVRLRGTSVAAPQVVRWLAYPETFQPGPTADQSNSADPSSSICQSAPSWPTKPEDKPRLGDRVVKRPNRPHIPPRKYLVNI